MWCQWWDAMANSCNMGNSNQIQRKWPNIWPGSLGAMYCFCLWRYLKLGRTRPSAVWYSCICFEQQLDYMTSRSPLQPLLFNVEVFLGSPSWTWNILVTISYFQDLSKYHTCFPLSERGTQEHSCRFHSSLQKSVWQRSESKVNRFL